MATRNADYYDATVSVMISCTYLDSIFARLARRGIVERGSQSSPSRSVLDLGKGFFSVSCRRGRSAGQSINVSHNHKSIDVFVT